MGKTIKLYVMYQYRLVKNVYRHRLVSEDDEGSLTNISSELTISIVWEKEFEEKITIYYFPPKRISLDGYFKGTVSINYELQIFENNEWCFVGFLKEKIND